MDVIDDRTVVDFQKTTFCGHPRAAVSKFLLQNIQLGHADYACYWSLELLCSGLVHTLWMSLFDAAAVHVNRANPNVFLYLASAYETYAPYESNYSALEMTKLRNNPDVRRMVCEAAAVIALCRKNKLPSLPTIKPSHDFDAVTLQESIRAPSTLYGKLVLRRDDPLSMAVPMNELCYCLRSDVRDTTRSLYWMSWIYAYCREHKKQTKSALTFADRSDEFVSGDHARHVVWMLWDAVKKQSQPNARTVLDVLYKMYCLRWSPTDAKSRQHLLSTAVLMVCEGGTLDTTPVTGQTLQTAQVLNGIPGWIDAIVKTRQSFSA
jgi:hypothetical protein